jgi:hypothetical protein
MLPVIPVPERFDVINTSFLITEYQTGKVAGLNAIILAEMQKEIAQKKFYANPDVADFVNTVMNLDPFPDKTIEEKALMESSGLAAKEDVVLSNYISDFVKQSMETDPTFNDKTSQEKRDILYKMAKDKLDELSTVNKFATDIFGNPPASTPGAPGAPGAPGSPAAPGAAPATTSVLPTVDKLPVVRVSVPKPPPMPNIM